MPAEPPRAGMIAATAGQRSLEGLDLSPFVGDFIVLAPTWLIGGVLLWRRKELGYVAGAGLLFVASTLFAGVSWVVVFPTLRSGVPLDVGGLVSMLAMAAICIVPLALYVRGIVQPSRKID